MFVVTNICLGYFIGYIRGRLHQQKWDEAVEKAIYVFGWRDGFYYTIDTYDEELYNKVRHRAFESYAEFKGYPHNRKH